MESWEFTLILTALTGGLIYLYLVWNYNYWKKRGIDGPKPKLFSGNVPSIITQSRNVAYDIDDIYREYKNKERFVGIYMLRNPQLLLIDPQLIREVLITNFKSFHANDHTTFVNAEADPLLAQNPFYLVGEEWKEKRAEVTTGLTTNKIKAVYCVTQDVCSQMTKYLERVTKSQPKDGIDAKKLAGAFTSEIIANCIYGIDAGAFTKGTSEVMEIGEAIMKRSFMDVVYFMLTTIFPPIQKIYSRPFIGKEQSNFFVDFVNQAIKMRLENKSERQDFLNYLLQLQEKKNISNFDIAAHTLSFFIDGFETSRVSIANTLHMLALHQDIQKRLRNEINSAISPDGKITFEKLNELQYLDQCTNESLRLHPSLFLNTKLCTQDCEITTMKDKKVKIEKGTSILLPYYSILNDEEYFPNPKVYDPDRFSPENGGLKKYKDMGVFLPFGDGPRICLGMKFAVCQSKAAIAELVHNWEITLNPKTQKEYIVDAKEFLCVPHGGTWLDFKRIEN